jgi:hypothetical protein
MAATLFYSFVLGCELSVPFQFSFLVLLLDLILHTGSLLELLELSLFLSYLAVEVMKSVSGTRFANLGSVIGSFETPERNAWIEVSTSQFDALSALQAFHTNQLVTDC